jgi:hypothetical protein
MPAPYDFGLRSRQDIIDWIMDNTQGYYRFPPGDNYPLAWNIRVRSFEWTNGKQGEYETNPLLDKRWESLVENDHEFFWLVAEDALRHYTEGEWTSYPGGDQGDWEFGVTGRSGGWLVLTAWRGDDLRNMERGDFWNWLTALDYQDLRKFYKGIACLNSDIRPDEEMAHHANYRRHDWEQSQIVDNLGLTPFARREVGC